MALFQVPPIAFLSLAGVFSGVAGTVILEPTFILPILNTLFLGLVPLSLAFLAARSYAVQGSRIFLLLGCAMTSTGLCSLFAGWGLAPYGENFSVTIYNLGSGVAGSFHLAGVALMYIGGSFAGSPRNRRAILPLVLAYSVTCLLLVVLSFLAAAHLLPVFFDRDRGPTLVRQMVLTAAGMTYAVSAIMLVGLHARTRMRFFVLYADALFLMAIGTGAVMLIKDVGGIIGWIGRTSQYVGGIYFIMALVASRRETRSENTSLPKYLAEMFRSQLDGEVEERTRDLLQLNRRLGEEVTERQEAEERLRSSEERLRVAAEATGFGIYAYEFETGLSYYSAEFLALFGLPPRAPLPLDADLVPRALHPDDRAEFLSRMTEANDPRGSRIFDMEYRITRGADEIRWLRVRGRTSFREINGAVRPARASGIVQDVTDRKLTEQRLQESEEIYRSVIENSLQGVSIVQDGRIVLCNDALCAMNGYSREEAYRMTQEEVLETIHPDDRPALDPEMRALGTSGALPPAQMIRLLDKAGKTHWVEILGGRALYRGAPAVQLSYIDVTQKRRAEETYRTLVEHAHDGLSIMQNGRVVFANSALARICGFEVRDLLGMKPEEIAGLIHPEDRSTILQNMAQRLAGGEAPNTQSFRILHRNGNTIVVQTQSVLVDYEGSPAVQVTYEDVTAARAAEEKLNTTHQKMRNLAVHLLHAREEERRKVAQEIHDEFGQALAALKMDMHWLDKHLRGVEPAVAEKIRGMILLSEQTISMVQSVSSQLRPRMLDDLGLAPALDWLADDFERRTGISCTVDTDFPPALIGGNAATTLYRVVQEALSNVSRHSQARKCVVQLRPSGAGIILRIEDDGIGITPAQAAAAESYGIIGIHERVEGLGGSLSIVGSKGEGTTLLAQIPLPGRRRACLTSRGSAPAAAPDLKTGWFGPGLPLYRWITCSQVGGKEVVVSSFVLHDFS